MHHTETLPSIAAITEMEGVIQCPVAYVRAVNDTLNVVQGKWKLPIIGTLLFGKRRFSEIERALPKITPRMLSKELKDLEVNGIVKRTVIDSTPVIVEYALTDAGLCFRRVLDVMVDWGMEHRKRMIG